jgi:hypothetical protein
MNRGRIIARLLTRFWDSGGGSPEVSEEELATVTPLLIASGCAGLAWRIINNSALTHSPAAGLLLDYYRDQSIKTALFEANIERVFHALRGEGIEPVLVKGWAVGRLYPEPGLRPYCDIDLCIEPGSRMRAEAALNSLFRRAGWINVDVHDGVSKLDTNTWDNLFSRSQLVTLNRTQVRVFSPEDHLRILCLHLLRHGAWRPLWLCDVAVALESQGAKMNWERCLTDEPRITRMLGCVIGLAYELLGAGLYGVPNRAGVNKIPPWLTDAVLRQWDRCQNPTGQGLAVPTLLSKLGRPGQLFADMYARWDQPIRATMEFKGDFGYSPRFPYQLAYLFSRCREIPKQVMFSLRTRATHG